MDFELVLAIAVSVTGFIWLVDMFWRWFKKRFLAVRPGGVERPAHRWIIEYARAFFPVLLIVFLLRSVAVEPFRIPSGSMLPTLQVGDFILVNKYQYGIRLPVVNMKLIEVGSPDYGDVMVFRFPHDENVNFIKRVVGLPGDSVEYRDKTISINGQEIAQDVVGEYWINPESNRKIQTQLFSESFGSEEQHKILIDEKRGARTLVFNVPEDTFFVLGDNRDYSNDSRFWGFVPEANLIGRAFFIWFSWDSAGGDGVNWSRIAASIE